MPANLSATEVAFTMIALVQAAFAVVWSIGAISLPSARAATTCWAIWAVLSGCTWWMFSGNIASPPLFGIAVGLAAVMALQRGVYLFIGRRSGHSQHLIALAAVCIADWYSRAYAVPHIATFMNFAVVAWLYLDIARVLFLYANRSFTSRWFALLPLPVLLGAVAYGTRSLRALVDPGSVTTDMATDSVLNVRAALIFVVLVVALHATLMVIVAGRLMGELHRLSRYDVLTGLLNRRAIEDLLQQQVSRSQRSRNGFVLMMLDLDHFKRINDQYGHAVGDLALKHASDVLAQAIEGSASLARFGGEEFVVLMPGSTLAQAAPIAERLRHLLQASPLPHASSYVELSMSMGVAEWDAACSEPSQVLLRADAALFAAKSRGRNCVVLADSIP